MLLRYPVIEGMQTFFMDINTECAGCFEGLSSKIRIKILNLLKQKGKLSVTEIVNNFKLTQPTISHHLKYLKECGILESERSGKNINYFICPRCQINNCGILGSIKQNA